MTCDIGNFCMTTANEGGMPSFEKCSGIPGNLKGLPSFGAADSSGLGNA